jgi:hypothetical protein
MPLGNVLVVEDDPLWCGIYERNVNPGLNGALRVTKTLAEARTAISEMAFAVAFVDLRLDEHDDENTDGMKVFELLSRAGDGTSSILVTGKGTPRITRDVLKEYDAFDAMEKDDADPTGLAEFVRRGTDFRNSSALDRPAADVLRGRQRADIWDSEMLHITRGKGGIGPLFNFLERLVGPFLPLVPEREGSTLKVNEQSSIATGAYWSRGVGAGVLIAIGTQESIRGAAGATELNGRALGGTLREKAVGNMAGVVRALPEATRADFA